MTKSMLARRDETVRKNSAVMTNGAVTKGAVTAPREVREVRPAATVSQSPQEFMDACEEAIRDLAYIKWEEAGCPSGDGHDFWLDAEREVVAARSDAMDMRPQQPR